MLNFFKKKEKVGGTIKYYGIEDFWLNTLSSEQREEVKLGYSEGLGLNPDSIDQGKIKHVGQRRSTFLIMMAQDISECTMKDYLLKWALREQDPDVIAWHFNFMTISDEYKSMIKTEKSYYPKQIEVLLKDCQLYDEFCKEYIKLDYYKEEEEGLPNYPSFRELAIAYERTGKIQDAIEISQLALEKGVNEDTSFERRISKLKRLC